MNDAGYRTEDDQQVVCCCRIGELKCKNICFHHDSWSYLWWEYEKIFIYGNSNFSKQISDTRYRFVSTGDLIIKPPTRSKKCVLLPRWTDFLRAFCSTEGRTLSHMLLLSPFCCIRELFSFIDCRCAIFFHSFLTRKNNNINRTYSSELLLLVCIWV